MMIHSQTSKGTLAAQRDRTRYAWLHYTGEYAYPDEIRNYLHKQWQRESDEMFTERIKWADPSMHLSTVIDELVGMVFANEGEASRQWVGESANGLGDPSQVGSPSYQLTVDADGRQTNWTTFWKEVAIEMTAMRRTWVLVDGVKMDGGAKVGEATVHHIKPWNVLETVYDERGNIKEAVIRVLQPRTKIGEEPATAYIHLTLDGWAKYKEFSGGQLTGALDQGDYTFYDDARKMKRCVPLFPCDLPLEREVGYSLARKVNSIFNMESVRDFAVRNITFNFLRIIGDDTEFNRKVEQLRAGTNVLQQNPNYSAQDDFISMDTGMVSASSEVLKSKIEAFYKAAFKEYNDAAAVRTATEIIQKTASSLNAFLLLLTGALDESENQALRLITQIYNPQTPDVWADTYVHRSIDFVPQDIETTINGLIKRYYGENTVVPTSPEIRAQVLEQIYRMDNLTVERDEIDQLSGEAQSNFTAQV
jgi:hypothetical protein